MQHNSLMRLNECVVSGNSWTNHVWLRVLPWKYIVGARVMSPIKAICSLCISASISMMNLSQRYNQHECLFIFFRGHFSSWPRVHFFQAETGNGWISVFFFCCCCCFFFVTRLLVAKSAVDDAGAFASAVHRERLPYSQVAGTRHMISMTL